MTHSWKVVPLSEGQLKDVRSEDVLDGGLFRKCETYRGGGGYDKFPTISESYFGIAHHSQFIVQLQGCNLDCPYCYVTREGVWGQAERISTATLVEAFQRAHYTHGVTVFHLMGGAPALQLKHWPELITALHAVCDFNWVFHSDLMLSEGHYDAGTLTALHQSGGLVLFAVDIKGLTAEEHFRNTRKPWNPSLFWYNLELLERYSVPYYFTFTNISEVNCIAFWEKYTVRWPTRVMRRQKESFQIDLIDYDALPFVDRVPWGVQTK